MSDRDDPLLIPPPPGTPKRRTDDPVEQGSQADPDAASAPFITLPPGILDSATHRLVGERVARPPDPVTVWRLVLPGGADAVEVRDALFVGRNPAATLDHAQAQLLAVTDPNKSVSKTHALFQLDSGHLFVSDLDSTNGVFVRASGQPEVRVAPGSRVAVEPGSTVELGDFALRVQR